MKFDFIKQYYQTILLIIEDKPKYEIPLVFYKTLIFISYLQIFIYVFSENETKQITDLKLGAIAKIIQTISIKNILQIRDSDAGSMITYIIIYIFMYSYFIYVGVLAIVKYFFQSFYESQKKFFISFNQILNMYFALFMQIFFNQYIELNSSILFCSSKSLFSTQRVTNSDTSTCTIPLWQTVLGILGLFLTAVTAWIAIYFFRNYEFMEYNLIKRKASALYFIFILLKFTLTILYFAGLSQEDYIKHILSQAIGIVSLLDYFLNHPYSDARVAHFYLKVISWYYSLVNISHIWILTNLLRINELFYFSLLFGVIIENGFQAINNYRYDQFLLTETKYNYIPAKLDFYLEEIIRLAVESLKDELSKIKLLKLIKNHQQSCQNLDCPCKISHSALQNAKQLQNLVKNSNQGNNNNTKKGSKIKEELSQVVEEIDKEIEFEWILQIVDSIFKFFLSQYIIKKDQAQYEHLSLKYITYMIKYLKNYTRSNYELKLLQFQRDDFSSYFKMISKIISDKIEIVISQTNIHLEQRRKDELSVRQIMGVDDITQKYIPIIIQIMGEKQKLWGQLQKGFNNMNNFQNESIKLMRLVRNTKNQFHSDMQVLARNLKVSQSLQYQKLFLIFNIFVLNDNIRAYELELIVQDLRKRDSLKEIDTLSNENYLRENIITLTISLSQNIGKIVSKKDDKTAHYFGYNKQDFHKIQKINELMPPYFSKVHDNILKQFVNSGESQYIKSSKHVYARSQTGFIMPIKIYLDFTFISDNDFQVNGTMLKVNQAFDYILFHKNGKVIGLTDRISQYILCNSIQNGNKLPSGDFISNNLNMHLLFPKIAKSILRRKESILQNLRSDGDVLLQDRKGQIILTSNPLYSLKKLQSYVAKMNQSKVTQSKVGSLEAINELDLFNETSFELINNFKKQDIDNSTAGLSSGRLSGGKVSNKSVTTKGSQSNRSHQKYRIRFKYTLSFSCTSSRLNTESDLFFSLKMSDVTLVKVKEKQRSYFRNNLCIYFFSTCLVNKIDMKLRSAQLNLSSVSQQLNEWTFTDQEIPTKLVKLATLNDNPNAAQANQKGAINEKKEQKENEENDIHQKIVHDHDDSSDEERDENNDYTDDEDGEDEITVNQLRNKKKVLDIYDNQAKFTELNEVFDQHQIQESDILKIDPNYKVKKVMQFRSLTSDFGRALEKAVIEAMLESQQEKNLLLVSNIEVDNQQEMATFRDFNIKNNSESIHLENGVSPNSIKQNPLQINKSISLVSKAQGIQQQQQQYQDANVSTNILNESSLLPSFNNQIINHENNIDVSSDNLYSYKQNEDKSKYFDASARPLFKQHEELNVPDNEILITPSIEDNHAYTQQTNAVTYQNAVEKKKQSIKSQQLPQLIQSQDMNRSINSKYIGGSSKIEQVKLQVKNNSSSQATQNKQQKEIQLTNEERKQLETVAQGIKSDQTRDNDEGIDDQSGKLHEKVVVQLLNQKGLVGNESINKGSIHSSSKSSTSYGGNFLRDNVIVLRQPRKYIRSYAKTLLGKIINYEIEIDVLNDYDGSIKKTADFYIDDGKKEYINLVQQYQTIIIEYGQLLQSQIDNKTRNYSVYEYQQEQKQEIDFALTFSNNINFIIGVQDTQNELTQVDSYLYLRANFFQFSEDIYNFGNFLVQNVLETVDTLIVKFTIIALSAIIGVIVVSLISLPIIRLINLYEEKILMIVSRINYDQSQIEKLKINICQQLIDIDSYDWLKYNYNDIICLRFDQFDANVVNSQHDLTKVSSRGKGVEKMNATNILKQQQQQLKQSQSANLQKTTQKISQKKDLVKQIQNKAFNDGASNYKEYKTSMQNSINKNYILQSKIINQKLSIFQRFIPLFVLTVCNTIYFLVIIIYLQQSKELLKTPVQFNQRLIQNHIALTTLKISVELLTYNSVIEQKKFTKLKSNDLEFYEQKMYEMIDRISGNSKINKDLIYGSNPYPSDILSTFKDYEEGRICQYLTKFTCDQTKTGNQYSLNYILQEKIRVIRQYPTVITKDETPLEQVLGFSNSLDHLNVFVNSFLTEDEVIDMYSSISNQSIGTISTQVQTFLEQYLQIFGNIFAVTIIIVCSLTWKNLYYRMQLMNLLLTFIPEEKLLEEVTLQMLKSLRRM